MLLRGVLEVAGVGGADLFLMLLVIYNKLTTRRVRISSSTVGSSALGGTMSSLGMATPMSDLRGTTRGGMIPTMGGGIRLPALRIQGF